MHKYTIIAGTKFKADGSALTLAEVSKAKQLARQALAQEFGGYTETKTKGGWINSKGELVTEPGVMFEMYSAATMVAELHSIARALARALSQESVLTAISPTNFLFIRG